MSKFLISGVSTGLGRAFGEAALAAGHDVIGTVRDAQAKSSFEALGPKARAVVLDVTDFDAIPRVIGELGTIDVLVNNAGYGHEGILEEATLADVRRQFDVNVFGAVALMQAVLPGMRAQRSGRIVNVTSMGGMITFPGIGIYNGSKFALEGISEALAKEVRHLGIFVTALAPGGFRTDWAGRSMVRVERSIADYDEVMNPVRAARKEKSGKQVGDPKKAAEALLTLVAMPDPPMHLLLGSDAMKLVGDKIDALRAEFARHEKLSLSTDV